jgi:hypothetical protein
VRRDPELASEIPLPAKQQPEVIQPLDGDVASSEQAKGTAMRNQFLSAWTKTLEDMLCPGLLGADREDAAKVIGQYRDNLRKLRPRPDKGETDLALSTTFRRRRDRRRSQGSTRRLSASKQVRFLRRPPTASSAKSPRFLTARKLQR